MKLTRYALAVAFSAILAVQSVVTAAEPAGPSEIAIQSAAQDGKLLYLLFYRETDAPTNAMFEVVKASTAQNPAAAWATVQISDPAQKAVVDRFEVSRAPMPMVIALHPYGAVTGAFQTRVTPEALAKCMISPKQAECMAALQQDQLVLICLQSQPAFTLPTAVRDWVNDPQYAQRTRVVTVATNDPAEAGFLAGMQIDGRQVPPATVFLAPPGVLVGKFPVTATKDQLAAKLADAGKCCEDENCKHNHKAATKPGKVQR